jgi:hypothetical protein
MPVLSQDAEKKIHICGLLLFSGQIALESLLRLERAVRLVALCDQLRRRGVRADRQAGGEKEGKCREGRVRDMGDLFHGFWVDVLFAPRSRRKKFRV